MTQTPKQPIYKYIAIPTDEHFNPDRPSLELACRGNRTMGSILNFLVSRASYIAEKGKLESCKVVSISIDRDEILKAIRISEKTFSTYLKELNELHYVDSKRYARREYDINFEAINEGIKNPPAQKLRGRPKGSKKRCESGSNKCEENTSTLQENTSTYVLELEKKVEVLSEKLKVLQLKVESITTFEKVLPLLWKVLPLSESDESIPQALREAFSKPLDVLDVNEMNIDNIYVNADALTRTPSQETSSENENYYQHDIPSVDNSQQASTDIPIATPTPQTELIGVATRNTESLPVTPPAPDQAKQNGKGGSRSPRASTKKVIDEKTQKRVDAVYETLNEFMREVMDDPSAKFAPTKAGTEAIIELLACGPTKERLLKVCQNMWDEKNKDGEYWWRKYGHMTIKAICNQYQSRVMSIESANKSKTPSGTLTNGDKTKAPSAAVAAGYTDYTNTPPTNYKPLPRKRA